MFRIHGMIKIPPTYSAPRTTRPSSSSLRIYTRYRQSKGVAARRRQRPVFQQQSQKAVAVSTIRPYSIMQNNSCMVLTKTPLTFMTTSKQAIKSSSRSRQRSNNRCNNKTKREQATKLMESPKKKSVTSSSLPSSAASSSSIPNPTKILHRMIPKIPGGSRPFIQNETFLPLSSRIALFLAISYILTHDDTPQLSPLHINVMDGPSMIPTIWPGGEMYLRDSFRHTLAEEKHGFKDDVPGYPWTNALNALTRCLTPARESRVGDVIVFVDYGGRYCCKRIVGVGGDVVLREGEFASTLFRGVEGLGVPVLPSSSHPSASASPVVEVVTDGGKVGMNSVRNGDNCVSEDMGATAVTVPDGYIWVEGDNPLYSIDSRHYGPLPLSNVRGRIIYRIWPRRRRRTVGVQPNSNSAGDRDCPENRINSCFVASIRPRPIVLRHGEAYGGN